MPFGDDLVEPPEQSPAADPRARLLAAVEALGQDELAVLTLVAERLALGRRAYGELRLASDRRDFRREALEECADGLAYAACALLRERPPGAEHDRVSADCARRLAEHADRLERAPRRLVGAERGR